MDITSFPRELLYKDRDNIGDFNIYVNNSVNSIIYRKINTIEDSYISKRTEKDYLDIFNDAYYFCVLVYIDKDAAGHIRDIIDVVFKSYKGPQEEFDNYKKLVLTIARGYLSTAFKNLSSIIPIKKYLDDKTYYVHGLSNKVDKELKITIDEFKPRVITSELLSKISWSELTNNFKLKNVHFCVQNLGSSNEEKLLIIKSIYKEEFHSDSLYTVPYEVDRYLLDKYREYGGDPNVDLRNGLKNSIYQDKYFVFLKTELCKDYKRDKEKDEKLYYNFSKFFKKRYAETNFIKLDYQNLNLTNENKSLKLYLSELQEIYYQLELRYELYLAEQKKNKKGKEELDRLKLREAEMKARVEAANAKVDELNCLIQDLKSKLGEKSVPLTIIVEGIKRKAKYAGVAAAHNLFEQIDVILYDVEAWRNNRIELMSFFEKLANPVPQIKVDVQSGGIAQITDKGIVNEQKKPDKLIE